MDNLRISLHNPDLTTARRVSQAINAFLGSPAATALDPATIRLSVPSGYDGSLVSLLTDVEQLRVEPDQPARVVIDEHTGVIVIGSQVRVDEVAIAQGNLTIRVTETAQVSQPSPFATTGDTTTVARTQIDVDEGADRRLTVLERGVSLQELVDGLNALGIGPRDMISILQTLRAAGALQAEILVIWMTPPLTAALDLGSAPTVDSIADRSAREAREAAEAFESIFLAQFLDQMFRGIETSGPFGGGFSEGIYRSMMNQEVANSISKAGGIGVADAVYREILSLQEI